MTRPIYNSDETLLLEQWETLDAIRACLPDSWFADLPLPDRVKKMVEHWNHCIKVNAQMQAELDDPKVSTIVAALERSGLSLVVLLAKKES